ncbi:ribokinase [Thermosporothrix hazakensis]|jgi:ribokinase|uniref:Ribokinase n=2 Tax=Thermosporothrix TaxID=768650 RepID=A0A326U1C1_THEHA|nr:ribokinase [Thermosporothrix hazakensis]PZW24688.1 ribokinase [Thermosporothrix hazakensis]BBH90330.1 ribokinase [Thermosporothrix sp. COM3]GCE48366.1 ribokinase [Thermosporothrix hazakensis]
MGRVVVLGSLIVDLMAQAPRLPRPGEAVIGESFHSLLGGKGINQAIAAARLGAQVTLIGRVGQDAYGDAFFDTLQQEGVLSSFVSRDAKAGTGVSLVIIATENGQNMIVVNPNANMQVPVADVEQALRGVQQEREREAPADEQAGRSHKAVFLCQCETNRETYTTGLRLARELGMTTILNAAPVSQLADTELFRSADILVVNEIEAATYANSSVTSLETARQAAERLLHYGPQHVIITLGSQGCLWSARESSGAVEHQALPPFAVQAVDSTGAGDAFCGVLAALLADNIPMLDALRQASAAGALTTTKRGAIAALPTLQQIQELIP